MNITLIGMPGAGKSHIGKILAERMKFAFVDIDKLIENKFKKNLQVILDEIGEELFIQEESNAALNIDGEGNIISPGGSIIYSNEAMNHLKGISKIIFLNVPLPVIKSRIAEESRGIVKLKGKSLEDVFEERLPFYRQFADLVININESKTEQDIINEILENVLNG